MFKGFQETSESFNRVFKGSIWGSHGGFSEEFVSVSKHYGEFEMILGNFRRFQGVQGSLRELQESSMWISVFQEVCGDF